MILGITLWIDYGWSQGESKYPTGICGLLLRILRAPSPSKRIGFGEHVPELPASPEVPQLFIISGVRENRNVPEVVERYKEAMLSDSFDYPSPSNRVGGLYHELSTVYIVKEGHHKLMAALSIAAEKGDWSYFKRLINHGGWRRSDAYPKYLDRGSLPVLEPPNLSPTQRENWKRSLKTFNPPWYSPLYSP